MRMTLVLIALLIVLLVLASCGSIMEALAPQTEYAGNSTAAVSVQGSPSGTPGVVIPAGSSAPHDAAMVALSTAAGLLPPPFNLVAAGALAWFGTHKYHTRKRAPSVAQGMDQVQQRLDGMKRELDGALTQLKS